MRRFINSLQGRAVSAVVVLSLLMPFIVFATARTAQAQSIEGPVTTLPSWAVVGFNVVKQGSSPELGKAAAEAMVTELAKQGKVDPIPTETVDRTIESLGLVTPLTARADMMRLGSELRASSVVSGEIVNQRVVAVNGGKRADIIMRVFVWDVASGQVVNGAALSASSGVRTGVEDETMLGEAISRGCFEALAEINRNTLPTATVLNTLDRQALINQGSRTGFSQGQEVIILRGREQVASGSVTRVEPDKSFISITRTMKGVQPGDRVRAVFSVPAVATAFRGNDGGVTVKPTRRTGNNSGLVSALLMVGLLVLVTHGNSNDPVNSVVAEATTVPAVPDNTPAVKISWKVDGFIKGNRDRVLFQVWRDDISDAPVMVAPGYQGFAVDRGNAADSFTFGDPAAYATHALTQADCNFTAPGNGGNGRVIVPGTAYTYSVELIYRVNANDLPTGGSGTTGGTTGTTAGTTGSTGLTGGTTGLTGRSTNLDTEYDRMFVEHQVTGGSTGTTGTTGGPTGGTTGTTATTGTTGTTATTGTTGTTGGTAGTAGDCYLRTERVVARGLATPLPRAGLRAPANDQLISTPPVFRFTSVRSNSNGIVIRYAIQFSPDPTFPQNRTATVFEFNDTAGTGTLSTPQAVPEALTVFPGEQVIYWRVGARNVADNPGPVLDGGSRFVFSAPWRFRRPTLPPGP